MTCEWGSCFAPAVAFVRFCNALGQPTSEGYWYCGYHADNVVLGCPRGDFIEHDTRNNDMTDPEIIACPLCGARVVRVLRQGAWTGYYVCVDCVELFEPPPPSFTPDDAIT